MVSHCPGHSTYSLNNTSNQYMVSQCHGHSSMGHGLGLSRIYNSSMSLLLTVWFNHRDSFWYFIIMDKVLSIYFNQTLRGSKLGFTQDRNIKLWHESLSSILYISSFSQIFHYWTITWCTTQKDAFMHSVRCHLQITMTKISLAICLL